MLAHSDFQGANVPKQGGQIVGGQNSTELLKLADDGKGTSMRSLHGVVRHT